MKKYQPFVGGMTLAIGLSFSSHAFKPMDLAEHWFKASDSKQYTLSQSTVFKLDKSCRATSQLENNRSVNETLHSELAVDTDIPLIEQSLFKDYSQFWTHEGQFYQLTAVWEYDVPALYRLEFYQSDSAQMNRAIKQLNHPMIPAHSVDAIEVGHIFKSVGDEYLKKGATAGANVVVSTVQDDLGQMHEVTFLNNLAVSWAQGEQACQLDDSLSTMHCACDVKTAHNHGEES